MLKLNLLRKSFLFSRLIFYLCSLYRSGRTQHQAKNANDINRPPPEFNRTSSKRLSSPPRIGGIEIDYFISELTILV